MVLPCFNEQDNLIELVDELLAVLLRLGRPFEIVCIDDGSTDGTAVVLAELARRHPELRLLRHVRNCGQSAALATGFACARGSILITMDSDRQNDPADIPLLLEALEGADAVCGVRLNRQDPWVRRVSSRIGNDFRNAVTGVLVADAGCSLRALRRDAAAELPVFDGMHRFLTTLLKLQGFTVREIGVRHRPRSAGVSKYGIRNRLFRGLLDCFAMCWFRRRAIPRARLVPEELR
jgi:dolichol-phosphate mannosyltransferase